MKQVERFDGACRRFGGRRNAHVKLLFFAITQTMKFGGEPGKLRILIKQLVLQELGKPDKPLMGSGFQLLTSKTRLPYDTGVSALDLPEDRPKYRSL